MSTETHDRPHTIVRPHSITSRVIKEPSTLESLARWSPAITPGQRATLRKQARRFSEGFGLRPRSTTDEGNDEAWEDNEAAEDWTEAAAVEIHACDGEPVRRATWWKSRLLLLTYVTGVQVWETREGFEGAIDELLNLRETDVVLCARLVACPASLGSSKDPLLALVTCPSPEATISTLKLYSLARHSVVQTMALPIRACEVQANERVIAVACESPPSIHLYSTETNKPLDCSPVLDVPSPPVLAFSTSRSLAYASLTPTTQERSNVLAHSKNWSDADPLMSPTERRSVSQGETARRIVVSGVKAIGNIGMTYWNARSQPQVYSRSAPGSSPSDLRAQAAPRHAGYVRVIDLKTEKTSAHFRPTESSVAILSFDPSGTMLLTGSSESRAFHVFELRGAEQGRLWHRFDLSRGMTSARAEAASWSEDGRFVSISTARGTAHVYAVSPTGGMPLLDGHFMTRPKSVDEVPPLSTSLTAVARIRPPRSTSTQSDSYSFPHLGPAVTFLLPADGHRHLALYYPHLGGLVLDKLTLRSRPAEPMSPSGLSQLLRAKDAIRLTSQVTLQHVSVWPLQRSLDWPEVQAPMATPKRASTKQLAGSAQAELNTFSRSPLVLPPSVYLSHQFDFLSLPKHCSSAFQRGDFSLSRAKRIAVRNAVEPDVDDERLRLLMQSALGLTPASAVGAEGPASSNGIRARRPSTSWQRSIPILSSARPSSSQSTTPCSVSFEDDDAVREVDSSTPVTNSLGSTSPPDDAWGFEEEATITPSKPAKEVEVVTSSSPPRIEYDDFGAGLLDEQELERTAAAASSRATLQPPIEPIKAVSGGKKRKGKKSPGRSLSSSPAT